MIIRAAVTCSDFKRSTQILLKNHLPRLPPVQPLMLWPEIFKPGARRPQHAWFLKIDPVRIICMCVCVCVCVCVRPRG